MSFNLKELRLLLEFNPKVNYLLVLIYKHFCYLISCMEVGDIIIMVFRILKYFSINSGLKVQNQYIHIEFKLCWAGNCMFKPWWLWSTVSTNKAMILGFFSHTLIRKCSGSG